MSDTNTVPAKRSFITLGNESFGLVMVKRKFKQRKADPANPGKHILIDAEEQFGAPGVTADEQAFTVDTFPALFGGLIKHAESLEAGRGVKLAHVLLDEHLQDSYEAAYNAESGTFDKAVYLKELGSITSARSKGHSLKDIDAELSLLACELAALSRVASTPDGWQSIKHPETGAPTFESRAKFNLRLSELFIRIDTLGESKVKKLAENQKRQEKIRDTKAAKAAAPAAPAPAAA